MARRASRAYRSGDEYRRIRKEHCDGFEVQIGSVPTVMANKNKTCLIDSVQGHMSDFIISNALVLSRKDVCYIWFTISHDSSVVTPRTMQQLHEACKTVQDHAGAFWGYEQEAIDAIRLTKIDTASDHLGSFITDNSMAAFNTVKKHLQSCVSKLFVSKATNFLWNEALSNL